MKALSIQEPYASLIANNLKHYETRSWKTNYRGKIYIHAGLRPYVGWKKDVNVNWFKGLLQCGKVVAVCDLVDCIPTEEVNVSDEERKLGFYSTGRYAWKLENIQMIEPFLAKGKLGIFDIKEEVNTCE